METRFVQWHPKTRQDFQRIQANHIAKIQEVTEWCLSHVPPFGSPRSLMLFEPWGLVNQLSVDDFRILYDDYPDANTVLVLLVFEKPSHVDTLTALKQWLGEEVVERRTRNP